jgi:hypothetical protein
LLLIEKKLQKKNDKEMNTNESIQQTNQDAIEHQLNIYILTTGKNHLFPDGGFFPF